MVKEYGELFKKEDFESNAFQLFVENDVKHQDNPKKKIYKSIKDSEKLIERNIRLVRLDVDNLVHMQTKKLDESIENFKPAWNNMNAIKYLKENNINNIDILKHGYLFRNLKQGKIL